MNSPSLIDRIGHFLQLRGLSERAACRAAGLKPDAIRNIRRGRSPRVETLLALAGIFDCDAADLLAAGPAPAESRASAPAALITGPGRRAGGLPLRSRAAGIGLSAVLMAAEEAEALAPPPLDLLVSPEAFAASIPGGAPAPLKHGDLVICDPQGTCAPGDLVLAEMTDGLYLVGILRAADKAGCRLHLAAGEETLEPAELRRLHRVVEIRLR